MLDKKIKSNDPIYHIYQDKDMGIWRARLGYIGFDFDPKTPTTMIYCDFGKSVTPCFNDALFHNRADAEREANNRNRISQSNR